MIDIYDKITQRIIEQLEKGVAPWKSSYFSKVGFPRNFSNGKEYRGINVLLLASQRFTSPNFLTFLQAKELGGHVREGERGYLIVKFGEYESSKESSGEPDNVESGKKRGYLRSFTVFHESQIEGVDFPPPVEMPELSLSEKTDRARAIIEAMPNRPVIHDSSAVPCYRPSTDSVHMPEKRYFTGEEAYYSTLFHELAHSTGHVSRIARKSLMENKGFGATGDTAKQTYCDEELVAEMAASFLNAHAGIEEAEIENSAAYLQSWASALRRKDASSWIVRAASEGQKAADYVLGRV